ncbi:FtsX-like permease family protein [Patescibacteria group bacterium]|nr:FtsX-like permease family protein [Patescibacteria group bacterium]MBU4082410.1 FtsX-like permease family protein [Patescibacteria group bacterium]MBU4141906.1 FtsX-like permease family protein [Patescibacteria group bacterium]
MKRLLFLISFAFRDASKNKLLLVLIVFSLGVAFSAIFISSSIFGGFQQMLADGEINWLGHLIVTPKSDQLSIPNINKVIQELNGIENIEAFSVRSYAVGGLAYKGKIFHAYRLLGVNPFYENNVSKLSGKVIEGDFVSSDDKKDIAIGFTLADSMEGFVYDGEKVSTDQKVQVMTMNGNSDIYNISGIIDAKTFLPNWLLIMPKEELEKLDDRQKDSEIIIKLKDEKKIKETKETIKEKNLDINVTTWKEQAGYIDDIMEAVSFITILINYLLTASVFIMITVIIFINVFNKRRQIGILKSMGATNKFVIGIYILETFVYAIFAYILGFLVFWAVHQYSLANPVSLLIGDFHTIFDVKTIWSSLITLFGASLGGSFIPSYIAAKTKIIDVIKGSV